jgi:nitroreductase
MDFDKVIRSRRMIKIFTDEPVAPEAIEALLVAANRGPSAGFSQGYAFLVVDSPERRAAFWRSLGKDPTGGDPIKRAPVIIVPLASKDLYLERYTWDDKGWTDRDEGRWPVPYWYIDTGFAAMLVLLAAVNEGLGAQFFGILPDVIAGFRTAFGIPNEYTPIGAIAVGHPDWPLLRKLGGAGIHPPRKVARRATEEIVHRDKWHGKRAS